MRLDPTPGAVVFTIPGNPVGKGRPIVGRSFGNGHATLRTPEKTANYETLVKMAGHQAMQGKALFIDAVAVMLDICVPIPASWSQRKRDKAQAGDILPTTKPDIDNVEKAVFDGLNGIAWKDDVQVVQVTKRKRYGLTPGVQVFISPAVGAIA
jgi:Holliday junction resolvase RusA-like endonuclease